jgi:hypothetical protein
MHKIILINASFCVTNFHAAACGSNFAEDERLSGAVLRENNKQNEKRPAVKRSVKQSRSNRLQIMSNQQLQNSRVHSYTAIIRRGSHA